MGCFKPIAPAPFRRRTVTKKLGYSINVSVFFLAVRIDFVHFASVKIQSRNSKLSIMRPQTIEWPHVPKLFPMPVHILYYPSKYCL